MSSAEAAVSKRPFLVRVLAIDRLVRGNVHLTVGQFAERFEVDKRTIQRDIEFLRDQLGAPLVYDRSRRGYTYSDKTFVLPAAVLTEGELVAVFIAERVLQQYRGTPYGDRVRAAFDKLCRFLPEEISIDPAQLADHFSVTTTATTVQDLEQFATLARAALNRQRVEIEYHTMSRDAINRRRIDPLHLGNINGNWYLFAYCHSRDEVRVFAPSRVRSVTLTGERFSPRERFSIAEYLKNTFSIIKGDSGVGPTTVRLQFSREVARYVRERVWHPSQQIDDAGHGELVLTMQLDGLDEIKRWVLSWGAAVTVLAPDALRAWVGAETLAMMKAHAKTTRGTGPGAPRQRKEQAS